MTLVAVHVGNGRGSRRCGDVAANEQSNDCGGYARAVLGTLWGSVVVFVSFLASWSLIARRNRPKRLDRSASSMCASHAPTGFYRDPLGDAWWRFWDGDRWTLETCNDRYPPTLERDAANVVDEVPVRPQVSPELRRGVKAGIIVIALAFPIGLALVPGFPKLSLLVFALVSACAVSMAFTFDSRPLGRGR
jgi:hypothetical protein